MAGSEPPSGESQCPRGNTRFHNMLQNTTVPSKKMILSFLETRHHDMPSALFLKTSFHVKDFYPRLLHGADICFFGRFSCV